MSIIFGILKFILLSFLLLFLLIFLVGNFALRKLRQKARNQGYQQSNPHAYQQQHQGEVKVEKQEKPLGKNEEYAEYEELD